MEALDKKYQEQLDVLAEQIQASEELANYLETEEEDDFVRLKEFFEPSIAALYELVASEKPLQLIALEKQLTDERFEGLFLPKILGYSVLRGEYDEEFNYLRPQDHFRDVLMAICNSANFDILKKRIGQSIQIGFALSSDIWITNLINQIPNKRIRYYLQSQKLEKYRVIESRAVGYQRYQRQFAHDNYHTAEFPDSLNELKVLYIPLKHFLMHRIRLKDADNSSLLPHLKAFVENELFQGSREYLHIVGLYASFFELAKKDRDHLAKHFNAVRTTMPEFDEEWLSFLLELHHGDLRLDAEADARISALVDRKIKDELSNYYDLTDTIHGKGYVDQEAQDAVKAFHDRHEGLSTINECVRQTIYGYIARFIRNLEVQDYPEFFELSKVFTLYMHIFVNQQFNQDIKELSMAYVQRCLKVFTDKRGKDYQDIKKFVSTTFQDLGFLKEKEVVELFKTRRKRKKTA